MSDFVQMMKDWRRMCKDRNCGSCNLKDSCNIDPEYRTDTDIRKIDTKVKIWAAEHPEPVYPTWIEWLMKCGVLMPTMDTDIVFSEDGKHLVTGVRFTLKAYEPMPADLAQKLGTEPKEE